jgi:predicted heme/steroid binding protein
MACRQVLSDEQWGRPEKYVREKRGEEMTEEKQFTPEELAKGGGAPGQPTYVAYQGKVYDVSPSPFWEEGDHMGHQAGQDLTAAMDEAPHGDEVFESFPQVGLLTNPKE